jgi:hypothetical protein
MRRRSSSLPLAHLVRLPKMRDGFSLHGGRYHFFDSRSFSAALSSIESANNFFSRAFSPTSCFKRLDLGQVKVAELALPIVEGCLADPTLAAQIGRLRTQLVLAQNPNDLLFRKSLPLHRPVLTSKGQTLVQTVSNRGGNVNPH